MSARTQARGDHPAERGGVEIRLPWWAIALPAVTFAALLMLLAGSPEAHASGGAGTGSETGIARLLERIGDGLLARSA